MTRPRSPRSSLASPPLRVGRPPRVAQAPTWPRNTTLGAPTLDTLDIQTSDVSVSLASSIHPESGWLQQLLLRASSPRFPCPGSKRTRQQKLRQGQHLLSVGWPAKGWGRIQSRVVPTPLACWLKGPIKKEDGREFHLALKG